MYIVLIVDSKHCDISLYIICMYCNYSITPGKYHIKNSLEHILMCF